MPQVTRFIAAAAIAAIFGGCSAEHRDWKTAHAAATESAYADFLAKHPTGPHAPGARILMEQSAWRAAGKGPPADSARFLDRYPDSSFAVLARAAIESSAWRSAEAEGTPRAFATFMARFPDSERTALAQHRLAESEAKARLDSILAAKDLAALRAFVLSPRPTRALDRFRFGPGDALAAGVSANAPRRGLGLALLQKFSLNYSLTVPPGVEAKMDAIKDGSVKISHGDVLVSVTDGKTGALCAGPTGATLEADLSATDIIPFTTEKITIGPNVFVAITAKDCAFTGEEGASLHYDASRGTFKVETGSVYHVHFD